MLASVASRPRFCAALTHTTHTMISTNVEWMKIGIPAIVPSFQAHFIGYVS